MVNTNATPFSEYTKRWKGDLIAGMESSEIRRAVLRALVAKNTLAVTARMLKKPDRQLNDMAAGRKSFGDKVARAMEENAGLPRYYFEDLANSNEQQAAAVDDEAVRKVDFESISNKQKEYPRVIGTAQMGDKGYYLDLDGGDGYLEIEAATGSIAIRVRGDSMFPAIRDGWFIVIEPDTMPAVGEYVLLKLNDGKKMVKELLQAKEDCYIVMSVNGGERITAMKADVEDICAVSAIVPPSKHKECF